MRIAALALALFGAACALSAEDGSVIIPTGGLALRAKLAMPQGTLKPPAVVALHGCGGPFPARDQQWADILTRAGHPVLFPNSFGSRGLGSQCKAPSRGVRPGRERRQDALAAAEWLASQPWAPAGGVVVIGWSHGGATVLATAKGVTPRETIRGFVAFYPGCRAYAERNDWAPAAPLLILIGADDDWTPAEPCRRLAARFPDLITLVEYPGAYHDFDVPDRPVVTRTGLAYTANGTGVAHVGTDPAAREDAIRRVLAFLDTLR